MPCCPRPSSACPDPAAARPGCGRAPTAAQASAGRPPTEACLLLPAFSHCGPIVMRYVAIFHANLNYAFLEEHKYEQVIRASYETIIDVIRKNVHPPKMSSRHLVTPSSRWRRKHLMPSARSRMQWHPASASSWVHHTATRSLRTCPWKTATGPTSSPCKFSRSTSASRPTF